MQLTLMSRNIAIELVSNCRISSSVCIFSWTFIYFRLKCSQMRYIFLCFFSITTMGKLIWLDCDPGHDDMFAIIMAALSEECQLIGISTSAGNSYIENTTRNALNILHEIGRNDIVVVKGASGPLCRPLETGGQIHGKSGLQGAELVTSPRQAITQKPFIEIYNRVMSQPTQIEFVVTGAMTNLAILLKAFPDIKSKIKGITFMGGAIGLGNWGPAAEFNILVDPQAATIVMDCKLPITMIPLEVSHTVLATEQIFTELRQLPSSFGKKLAPLFRYFQQAYINCQNFPYPPVHDPCTIYYLLQPQDFTYRQAKVQIQLEGKSRGRTNCHFMNQVPNVRVCEAVKVDRFWQTMLGCLRKIK